MKSLLKTTLCLLLLSCLLIGCVQEEEIPGNEETDLIQAEPEEETETSPITNILPEHFSLPYAPGKTLNPITCQDGIQQVVASLLCDPLFRMTPELEPEPCLCADYTYDAETMTYTLFLREDILFSDGTPLTAADVKAALEEARTSVRYGDRLKHVTSVKTEGEQTVFITLSTSHSGFLSLLDIPIAKQDTADSVPIGTGPYLFSYTEGSAALIANQLWWRTGTQPVDRISLVETPDQDAIRYRFTSHDIQLVTADLAGTNPYTAIKNTKSQDVDTTILQYIGLNTLREPLNSPAFRDVLQKGLDRSFLINAFLSGHGLPAQFPVSPRSSVYPTALEKEYTLDAFISAAAALESLPQQPLVFLVNAENSFKVSLAEYLASVYSKQGIPMEVRVLPWEEYTLALQAGDFDLYYGEVKLTADWDLTPLLATGGALNYGGWSHPQTDAFLQSYTSATNRAQSMRTLSVHLQAQNPILPLCFKRTSVLMQNHVISNLQSTASEAFYGLTDCTIHLASAFAAA